MVTCQICGKTCQSNKGLSDHLSKHQRKYIDYILEFQHHNVWPTCKCGCGTQVKFVNGNFLTYVKTHVSKTYKGCSRSDETKAKMSSAKIGIKFTKEHREALSLSTTSAYLKGFNWRRASYTSTKSNRQYTYRSSWEHAYMIKFDEDPTILDWFYEPVRIAYIFDGITKHYIPDFIVLTAIERTMIEIKPEGLKNTPVNIAKRTSALAYCALNGMNYEERSNPEVVLSLVSSK
jgi:hypothetical protein